MLRNMIKIFILGLCCVLLLDRIDDDESKEESEGKKMKNLENKKVRDKRNENQ